MLKNILASPYEIYDVLIEANHQQKNQMLKLRIAPIGKNGAVRDVKHNDLYDRWNRLGKIRGRGDPIDEEQCIDRYARSHI